MKYFLVLAVIVFSSTTFASHLEGTWELKSQSCSSGVAPVDAFQIGRDIENVTFNNVDKFQLLLRIKSTFLALSGTYTEGGNMLCLTPTNEISNDANWLGQANETSCAEFEMITPSKVILKSSGFEEGGTCPQGDILSSEFHLN